MHFNLQSCGELAPPPPSPLPLRRAHTKDTVKGEGKKKKNPARINSISYAHLKQKRKEPGSKKTNNAKRYSKSTPP